jgi:ABC-type multidrug transport system ATPase subunit
MKAFRDKYEKTLLNNAPVANADQTNYRAWTRRFAKWLYGTDHISIRYGILYDGIDIHKLSPGTRGIVVLTLYLALDRNDISPLIIDQPEENLDPKSIFDELVPIFEAAKQRRQVIMVTHNANLVVNANADQIIIASVGSHTTEGLPPISYYGGGMEEACIRKEVCDILEGGQDAFKERARRLRVAFER